MKRIILTVFALFISTGPASGLEIEHHQIESAVLGESREYLIHLPPSYDDPGIEPRSYPVHLLLDGVEQALDALSRAGGAFVHLRGRR